MTMHKMLAAAVLVTAAFAAVPMSASADPACAEAQASGLFLVEHVGPLCVQTPFSTTTHTETVQVGVETVTVSATTP